MSIRSIRTLCPNDHAFDSPYGSAGKVTLWPICESRVRVPDPEDIFSEEAIMDVLQPEESGLLGSYARAYAPC